MNRPAPAMNLRKLFLAALLVAVCAPLFLAGCAHTDPANRAERPWNSPKGWENGLPSGMMQGR